MTSLFTNQVAKRVWKRPRPEPPLGAVGAADPAGPDVELAAVGPLCERGRVRRRRRAGEPAARAGAGAAGGSGRDVAESRRARTIRAMCSQDSASAPALRCSARGSCRRWCRRSIPTADPLRVDTPARPDGDGRGAGRQSRVRRRDGCRCHRRRCEKRCRAAEIVEVEGSDDVEKVLRAAADGRRGARSRRRRRHGVVRAQASRSRRAFRWRSSRVGRSTTSPRTSVARPWPRRSRRSRRGSVACVDMVCLNDTHMVINTASIGAYPSSCRPGRSSSTRSASRWRASTRCSTRCARDEPVRIRYDNKSLADVAVLPRQFDIPAIGVRPVAPDPDGRRPDGRPHPRNGSPVQQDAHPRRRWRWAG